MRSSGSGVLFRDRRAVGRRLAMCGPGRRPGGEVGGVVSAGSDRGGGRSKGGKVEGTVTTGGTSRGGRLNAVGGRKRARREPRGLEITRFFTRAGEDPFDAVEWKLNGFLMP